MGVFIFDVASVSRSVKARDGEVLTFTCQGCTAGVTEAYLADDCGEKGKVGTPRAVANGTAPELSVAVDVGGTQTGSYQTGSYQKGRFIPPKPKVFVLLFDTTPFICL